MACDGPDTGGCRDHSCGTLDSNPRGGGLAASAGRSVPVDSSTTGTERESDDHPPEHIFSPPKRKTPQPPRASAGFQFFRVETLRGLERSIVATEASQDAVDSPGCKADRPYHPMLASNLTRTSP